MTKQKFGPTALWRLKVNGLALTALAGMGLGRTFGSYKGQVQRAGKYDLAKEVLCCSM